MTREGEDGSLDMLAVVTDDELLDEVACGIPVEHSDSLAVTLAGWRRELDDAAHAGEAAPPPAPPRHLVALSAGKKALRQATTTVVAAPDPVPVDGVRPRGARLRRGALAGLAAVTMVAGGGVAAAAISGPHGPLGGLHRVLFGEADRTDPVTLRIDRLLDGAERTIAAAQPTGLVTLPAHRRAAAQLAEAATLLVKQKHPDMSLLARLATARSALAALRIAARPIQPAAIVSRAAGTPAPAGSRGSPADGSSGRADHDSRVTPHDPADTRLQPTAPAVSNPDDSSRDSAGAGSDNASGGGESSGSGSGGGDSSGTGSGSGSRGGDISGTGSGSGTGRGDTSGDISGTGSGSGTGGGDRSGGADAPKVSPASTCPTQSRC